MVSEDDDASTDRQSSSCSWASARPTCWPTGTVPRVTDRKRRLTDRHGTSRHWSEASTERPPLVIDHVLSFWTVWSRRPLTVVLYRICRRPLTVVLNRRCWRTRAVVLNRRCWRTRTVVLTQRCWRTRAVVLTNVADEHVRLFWTNVADEHVLWLRTNVADEHVLLLLTGVHVRGRWRRRTAGSTWPSNWPMTMTLVVDDCDR